MPQLIDLSGQTFGRLRVLSRAENRSMGVFRGTAVAWHCACECGTLTIVRSGKLRSGSTNSCGCLHKDRSSDVNFKHGQSSYPNNGRVTKEYNTWALMRKRCLKPNTRAYKEYGGRGIKICERWNSFENFFADMGPAPTKLHSLDRIDVNGPYAPENCRWATDKMQARNKRTTVYLTALGETRPMAEWAELMGIQNKRIHARLKRGWDVERAIFTPV